MTIMTCEKCGKQTVKVSVCTYCSKKACVSCIKCAKKVKKTRDLFICKTCWGNIKTRTKFKAA